MNLFEQRDFSSKEIEHRAEHLFKIAREVDAELSDGDFEVIPYMSTYNGLCYELDDW